MEQVEKSYSAVNGSRVVPVGSRVLVLRDAAETKSAGGILLAVSGNNNNVCVGTVVAVGPGEVSMDTGVVRPMNMNIGDRVMFAQYSGTTVEIGDEKLLLLTESEIQLRVLQA
jgi:chaperonin GroES